jgi:Cof subfamily protein (haloacid dehalogenase superfamily)
MTPDRIRLLLADVDGTLVTQQKELTARTIAAVDQLEEAGVLFALTSGRPPRGMSMIVDALQLTTPLAAFNGGVIVQPTDMTVIEQKVIPPELVAPVIALLQRFELDVWLYRGADWYVRNLDAPYVAHEASTVKFQPTVVESLDGIVDGLAKIVGVSDDLEAVAEGSSAGHDEFGDHVSVARSQPYYVDVTHPDANKGSVAIYLSRTFGIPSSEIATIGDMPNDVLMFAHSGLSIAMGNASLEVQRAARRVTSTNEDEGFANAVERFVLARAPERIAR